MMSNELQIDRIRENYFYLVNYSSDDPTDPIDPLSYSDSNGDALIHIAASIGDVDTVRFLLDAGINIAIAGDMGNTALHYALSNGATAAVTLLLERGAPQDIQNHFGRLPGDFHKVE